METKTELLDETQHSERNHGNRSTNHSQAGTYQYLLASKYRHLYLSSGIIHRCAGRSSNTGWFQVRRGHERWMLFSLIHQFDPSATTFMYYLHVPTFTYMNVRQQRVLQTGHGGGYSLLSLLLLLVQVSAHKHSHLTTGPALLTLQQVGQEQRQTWRWNTHKSTRTHTHWPGYPDSLRSS